MTNRQLAIIALLIISVLIAMLANNLPTDNKTEKQSVAKNKPTPQQTDDAIYHATRKSS